MEKFLFHAPAVSKNSCHVFCGSMFWFSNRFFSLTLWRRGSEVALCRKAEERRLETETALGPRTRRWLFITVVTAVWSSLYENTFAKCTGWSLYGEQWCSLTPELSSSGKDSEQQVEQIQTRRRSIASLLLVTFSSSPSSTSIPLYTSPGIYKPMMERSCPGNIKLVTFVTNNSKITDHFHSFNVNASGNKK